MDTVTLTRCVKCSLEWINRGEVHCPRCRSHSSTPSDPVIICGYEVQVSALVLHGSDMGLRDPLVRKGLDILNLFERCQHGYVSFRICQKCYKMYQKS